MAGSNLKPSWPSRLLLATPRGFCVGVRRAVETLYQATRKFPDKTIYCYHQIVHNKFVVKEFTEKGVVFVDSLEKVPPESIIVFSAHGVSPQVIQQARDKKLTIIDATCPFVLKTHMEVKKYSLLGYTIIYLGQVNHDEATGTVGEAPQSTVVIEKTEEAQNLNFPASTKFALVTQTTLSLDDTQIMRKILQAKFPHLAEPPKADICEATQNRQNGVKELIKNGAQAIIVLGSANSSNSNKLKKVAEKAGVKAYLIDEISQINPNDLAATCCVGLTAGASLPENILLAAVDYFKTHGTNDIKEITAAKENQLKLAPVRIV